MLQGDVDRLRECIKEEKWHTLLNAGRPEDKRWLIDMSKQYFMKSGSFADKVTGEVTEKQFIDYSFSLDQVASIIKANRKEIIKGW